MCFEQATVSPTASSLSLSVPASPDHLWDAPVDGAHSRVSSSSFAGCTR